MARALSPGSFFVCLPLGDTLPTHLPLCSRELLVAPYVADVPPLPNLHVSVPMNCCAPLLRDRSSGKE
ncbi:MAG: hypothetical protein K0R39_4281 [Symbiobacteriaceae bacterium]|jgi:hypothetical protein|nr:hypothetical protein [Symbiobacteriaceae bacterium]